MYNYTAYSVTPVAIELAKNKDKIRAHFKIWDIQNLETDYFAIRLERLYTLQMTNDKYPYNRYQIWIYKRTDKFDVTFLQSVTNLNKSDALTYKLDTIDYRNTVGFTSYSLTSIKEFLKMKKVQKVEDVGKIMNELNKNEYTYQIIVRNYEENLKMPDTYAQGLTSTIMNMIYFKLGYCPVGASIVINNILESNIIPFEKKEKLVKDFYENLYIE